MNLIDKDVIVAEIEKRIEINSKSYLQCFLNSDDARDSFGHKVEEDKEILSIVNSIKVIKDVELNSIEL